MNDASIALNRFGLGHRPGDSLPVDARGWLLAQLDRYESLPPAWRARPRTPQLAQWLLAREVAVRQASSDAKPALRSALMADARREYLEAIGARTLACLHARAPFAERLVHFWANHFAVSADGKIPVVGLAGAYEADAIRPHLLGRFEDMLLAVLRHPAMLLYLDQSSSVGPNSAAGRRAADRGRRRGLNENLAREVLELHTLGVRSGYAQSDVTEFARALTGWGVADAATVAGAPFQFRATLHEPGSRTILGRRYREGGEVQALAVASDIARAPATARHVATKLAQHFAGDEPPDTLVERLAATFERTEGDLPSVYRELVAAPECWQVRPAKFKSPWDWAISSLRALSTSAVVPAEMAALLADLGQPVWRPGSPAGYRDTSAAWAAPHALLRRIEAAQRLVARSGDAPSALALAERLVPGSLGEATVRVVATAESEADRLTLLLVSPEFLRR